MHTGLSIRRIAESRRVGRAAILCGACLAAATGPGTPAPAAMRIGGTHCEYAIDPIGIDTLQPRLGWTLQDEARDQRQTAYQIRVAASPEDLAEDRNLLWDTGKVASDRSTHVVYSGAPLRAGQRCAWSVRAWDRDDRPTPWSAPASWQVALLDASDWHVAWIGPPEGAATVWTDFTLGAEITLQKEAAGLVFRARDRDNFYLWQINSAVGPEPLLRPHVCRDGQWSFLPPVPLRKFIPAGDDAKPHRVEIEVRGARIRTRIDGHVVDEREDGTFASGTVGFRADSRERFTVETLRVTGPDGALLLQEEFEQAPAGFPGARIEGGRLVVAGATLLRGGPLPKDCPRLRGTFAVDRPVRRATASVCGLGFYELYLNGTKVGDRVLAPPNTPYAQRILFETLDVTAHLRPGANAAGLWLAPGYSDDYSRWGWKWEAPKRAILQIDVVYADGTTARFGTGDGWQAGPSPLTFASLYDGEVCDARIEAPAWSRPEFDAKGWGPVRVLPPPGGRLAPDTMPPVRVMQTLRPVAVTEPQPGVFVADFGQNFAGWVRLRAHGPRGTRVAMRHSELAGGDGRIDPWTNRRAKATDVYVLGGGGDEVYEPRFTYHGFRYVEVTGHPGRPAPDDLTGCVVHADVRPEGRFVTSDPALNRIAINAAWSMRSNFMGIPTDCCMRDERTPCLMDSQAYEDAALYAFSMVPFYTKWLDDIRGGRGSPDWNGDAVALPWRLYRHAGDVRALERNYESMRGQVEAAGAQSDGHVCTNGFGDWCPPNDGTWAGYHGDVTEVNTSLQADHARIVAEAAAVLGRTNDAARFRMLADDTAGALFARRFDPKTGSYGDGSQTTALLPLAFDLVPPDRRPAVFNRLVATIRGRDRGRIDTGIFGTRHLADVLCDFGQPDLAVSMLTQPEYPGFGFQLANGATTLWEQWTVHGGMNSHNHAMFAGFVASLYSRIAGLRPRAPGFAEIDIRPVFPAALAFAEAEVPTVKGRVFVRWERAGGGLRLRLSVPANTSAFLALPCPDPARITEGGKPLATAGGVRAVRRDGRTTVVDLGSGDYALDVPAP